MITVLADRHINHLKSYLPPEITCITFNPEIGPEEEQLQQADALLVRTVTKVDEHVLNQAPRLQFIGTASAGSDHIDKDLLKRRNIIFASSPGCNARSVAEYVAISILVWCEKRKVSQNELSVGIVGVGNAGSQVQGLLDKIGLKTFGYDPPRQRRDPNFTSDDLSDILSCNIISLHVPLIHSGEDATYNLLDEQKIKNSSYKLIINSARGGIADEAALIEAKNTRNSDFILDVWNNEPFFDDNIANAAFFATPHIAGYSKQSKLKATKMVCDTLNEYFNLEKPGDVQDTTAKKNIDPNDNKTLESLLTHIHPIQHYNEQLRLLIGLTDEEKAINFARLRNEIPLREELGNNRLPQGILNQYPILEGLGVKSITE